MGRDGSRSVFAFESGGERGAALHDLGPREDACREPINVLFDGPERWRPISNLAETWFILDGRAYASVEGFWQGLKFEAERDRKRIAALWGKAPKRAAGASRSATPSPTRGGRTRPAAPAIMN